MSFKLCSLGHTFFALGLALSGCANPDNGHLAGDVEGSGAQAGTTGASGGSGGVGGPSGGGSGGVATGGTDSGGSGGTGNGGSGGTGSGGSGGVGSGGSGGTGSGGSGGVGSGGSGGTGSGGSGGVGSGGSGGVGSGGSGGVGSGGSGGVGSGGSGGVGSGGSGGVGSGGSGGSGGSVNIPTVSQLLDVDAAVGSAIEVGPAVLGLAAGDFWNPVAGAFQTDFSVSGLMWSDKTPAGVDVHVVNLPGTWSFASPPANGDAMYTGYIYSWSGSAASLTFSKLPAGSYVVATYGHEGGAGSNSGFSLSVHDSESLPAITTTSVEYTALDSSWNSVQWTEGGQYVLLGPVSLTAGQLLRVNVVNGAQGTGNAGCIVNGLQIGKL